MNTICEERRKSWQTLIESTDMTHSRKKEAWANDTNTLQRSTKGNATANLVAYQLLLNGRTPNKLPKYVSIESIVERKAAGLDDIQT